MAPEGMRRREDDPIHGVYSEALAFSGRPADMGQRRRTSWATEADGLAAEAPRLRPPVEAAKPTNERVS